MIPVKTTGKLSSEYLDSHRLTMKHQLASFLILVGATLGCPGATNEISLALSYPPEKLKAILLPPDQWRPFPRLADRPGWQALPEPARTLLVRQGEEALGKPVPFLPATLYLEYQRVGNRSRFEAVHRERRQLLQALVLAECVEAKGRFRGALGNLLWAICEESSWCYPAHIGVQQTGTGLPDVTEPIVDLFAAETGVSLTWTYYLLGADLDQFSKRLRSRLELEIQRRILAPVLERNDFGWMGFKERSRGGRPNNWNPWINASVLTATLVMETNTERRVQLTHKILRSLDCFVQPYPSDGSCDEGPGYWGHAGGSLYDNLELLYSVTGGKLDLFGHPLVREIGKFIQRAHIGGDWFVPVGDCSARLDYDRGLIFRVGKRLNDESLKEFGAFETTAENAVGSSGGRFFGRQLMALFDLEAMLATPAKSIPLDRDVWLGSQDMELMTARSESNSAQGFFVAAWGAHNAQSHNHNDVGNFLVFADGRPILVDAGAPAYTAQTFSSKRYELWPMQSAFHNLPTINGVMQGAGRRFAAQQVRYTANDAVAELRMDVAPAYPEAAKVASWVRTVRLQRGKQVEVSESFELKEVAGPTTLNYLTPLEIEIVKPGLLNLKTAKTETGKPLLLQFEYDADKLSPSVEPVLTENDDRLAKVWGHHLNRLILRTTQALKKQECHIRLTSS